MSPKEDVRAEENRDRRRGGIHDVPLIIIKAKSIAAMEKSTGFIVAPFAADPPLPC